MRRSTANLISTLCTGYILFFFSERLFWTVLWPDASGVDLTITWLAYSAVAYLLLAVASWFAVEDLCGAFVAGAIYGWLVEGGIANTLYGTQPSAPFPWSISLTGLSWHAPLAVVAGWWGTKRLLASGNGWGLAALSAVLGAFWGVWAMFPRQESPPIVVSVEQFAIEALGWTLGLMVSWRLLAAPSQAPFRPGWIGLALSTLALGLFYVQHVMAIGLRAIVMLPALVGGAAFVLWLDRRGRSTEVAGGSEPKAPSVVCLASLLAMPATATVVFATASAAGWDRLPVAATTYSIMRVAGFAMLFLSVGGIVKRSVGRRS